MADLKINVIAVDKASGQINKVAGAAQNLAQQLGTLAPGIGRLTNQLGALIGAGGMAGLSVAIAGLILSIPKLEDELVDWALGLSKVREEYEKLAPVLERHLKQVTAVRNQTALLRLEGSARVAVERAQKEKEVNDLERRIEILTRRRATQEAEVAKRTGATGMIPGAGFIPGLRPGLEGARKNLKETEDELGELRMALRLANEQAVQLDETLELEKTKEGKKNLEELNKALEKQRQALEAIDQELEKRFGGNKPVIAPEVPMPILGPSLFGPGEMTELQFKEAESIEELNQQALRSGIKRIETEFDFYNDQAKKSFDKVDRMNERRAEEQRRQWEHMLDSIREGAGRIFDAMLTKGESVFSSLARFAEGVLQTMLRNVFQNAVQVLALSSGLGGLFGGGGRGGGGAGALAGGAASSGLGAIFGGLLGGGGAAAGATAGYATSGGITYAAGAGSAAAGGGGIFGGLFGGGAAGAATMGGTLAAGAATAGIAVAAVLATSYISGLFKAGENRRLQEQARRAGIIQGQQFAAPETQTRFGIAGGAGYSVETDLTGSIRGIGKTPTVVVNVQNQMIDARHAREAGAVIGQEVSRQILQGGSYLADNIAWAAS